ncbi:MAG TPA: Gfo/Idh/MocA family oxidoreductase [Planctomycetaceae bacterium]|nr:Gfo/Idh/MocA family oxidoreductase [Planctomycetaceae bacterium]
MKNINLGVIGVGALGRHHARILAGLDGVNLIGVADSSEERGRAVAESSECKWFADYVEMLDEVDAVSVAVPTFSHKSVALECLARNIPMMMEKPLAGNLSDAREIAALATERNVTLQVGHVERFNPATIAASKCCSNPKYIRSERLSSFSFRSTDISIIHDLMIHDIDLVLGFNNSPIKDVQAFGIALFGDLEDAVQARLVFENGCIADLSASRISPVADRTMQVWSAEGCVTVDFTSREVKRYSPGKALTEGPSPVELALQPGADIERMKQDVFGSYIEVEDQPVENQDALTAELAHFVECVISGSTPLVNAWTAVRALEVADQIREKVQTHTWTNRAAGPIGPHVISREKSSKKAA